MKRVIVGSCNPVKIATAEAAFALAFPNETFSIEGFNAVSGVPDQPFGKTETKLGAQNRALHCKTLYPDADFFVGLEGGLEKVEDEYWASAWMCVIDAKGVISFGRTAEFLLPPRVSLLIDQGKELGEATDIVFDEINSKHKGGTVGILTNDVISRKDFYTDALVFALIPFMHPELYT